ncbi:MAG: transcription antitermination factor NusB [Planctomycetota bacterium]
MRKRTQAREVALKALYLLDVRGDEIVPELDGYLREDTQDEDVLSYARVLIDGVREHLREIDEQIAAAAQNWELKRLAVVDRNILRIAVFELLREADVPARAVLNEAIEIGKKFSTAQSGAFINGVLDKVLSRLPGRSTPGA